VLVLLQDNISSGHSMHAATCILLLSKLHTSDGAAATSRSAKKRAFSCRPKERLLWMLCSRYCSM